jgi:hypothetical protein
VVCPETRMTKRMSNKGEKCKKKRRRKEKKGVIEKYELYLSKHMVMGF